MWFGVIQADNEKRRIDDVQAVRVIGAFLPLEHISQLGPGLAVEAFDRNEELIEEPKDLAGETFMDDACDGNADAEAVEAEED